MTIPQVTGPISKSLPPPSHLTDVLQMASSQGVLLNLKSQQEMMLMFSGIVSKSKHIFDCQHVRLQQGGIEVNLLMMSSLFHDPDSSLKEVGGSVNESDFASSTDTQSLSVAQACHQPIQKEINHIFQYKRFQNETVMANSLLHTLNVVQDATHAWMRERRLLALSKHDKARVLREFLSRCIIQELSPDPGHPPPRNLPQVVSPPLRKQWIEYLILLWQHVDGKTRQRVVKILDTKTNSLLGNGTYSRRTQAARERLAALIWQKEMQTQQLPSL